MSSRRPDIRTQNTRNTQRLFFSAISASAALIVVLAVALPGLDAQASKTRAHVEALASPRLEGRLAGTNGERLASDYLAGELQKIGAKPLPGQQDFRLPFEFTAGTKDGGSTVQFDSASRKARALSFSDNGDVDGAVVE